MIPNVRKRKETGDHMSDEEYELYQKAVDDYDTLKGCINRLFVSDDKEEVPKMYESAKYHLDRIYHYGIERLSKGDHTPSEGAGGD